MWHIHNKTSDQSNTLEVLPYDCFNMLKRHYFLNVDVYPVPSMILWGGQFHKRKNCLVCQQLFMAKKSLASVKAEFCRHLWLSFQSKLPDIKFGEGQRAILLRNRSQDAFLSPGVPARNALPCHLKNLLFNGPLIEETCKNNFKKNNFFVKWLT